MTPRSNKLQRLACRVLVSGLGVIALPLTAEASWIDTDPVCQQYGCVVVHNGVSFSVYDNYDAAAGRALRPGEPLVLRASATLPGIGTVEPVITGSLDTALSAAPLQDQGAMLGLDTNADGIADQMPMDMNGSGFLDAGDAMNAFFIDTQTSLVGASTSYQRSFYMASTVDFVISAQILPGAATVGLDIGNTWTGIGFTYQVQRTGNDGGYAFGDRAQKGNNYRPLGTVTTLGDLVGRPVEIMEVRKQIAKRPKRDSTLADQSVRFDFVYDFAGYNMAMGNGELDFQIEFDFYSR